MARKYTEDYIQKLIDDNGWAPEPKERVNTETWQRASKSSTEIPTLKQQSGAGRTSSASSVTRQPKTQNTVLQKKNVSDMTDDDMLNRIRTYRQSGYQISDDEANELNEIRLAAIDSSSKAGVLASDRVVLPGGTTLTEAERKSLIDGSAYEIPRDYETEPVTSADIEKWLSDGYKMTDTEKKAAKEAAEQYFDNLDIGSMSTEEQIALTNGENEEYNRMRRLQNKSSGIASFAMGLLDTAKPLLSGLGDLLESEQYDNQLESFRQTESDARTQSPVAYNAGDMAMNAAEYATAQGILSEIPVLNNLRTATSGKIANVLGGSEGAKRFAKSAVNVLGDTGLDMALDIIPSLVSDRANGLSDEEVRNNAIFNIGTSLGGNILGEAFSVIPYLREQSAQAGNVSNTVGDVPRSADNTAETASRAATDAITETAARQTDDFIDMSNVSDMELNSTTQQVEPVNVETSSSISQEVQSANSTVNTKTSRTRTNTMPGTGVMTEEELATRAPEAIFQYVPVNEQETLTQATEMIQRDGAENTLNNLLKKEALTAIDTDALMSLWRSTVQQAQQLDASGVDSSALWERANQIFKKVQEQSTRNGQALQALKKWSQGTPEGMLAAAERAVNNRAFKTDNVDRIQKVLDKQLKRSKRQVEFSPEFQKEFLNLAEQATQVSDINSREAKEIMARLGKLAADYLPATLGEKAKTFLMNNMLGNFRTLISRNAGGNLGFNAIEQFVTKPIAAGIDRLAALKTGKRTTAGLSKEGVQEYLSGFKRGIADEARDVKTGLYTAKTGENTIENAINNNRRVFKNPVLNAKDAYVRHGLSVGDRPFYEAAYSGALSDVYQLRRKGLLGDEVQGLSDDAFKEYAETVARQRALEAVYQDNSLFSRGMSKLKEGLSDVSKGAIGVDVLSQTSMPFTRTPANIVSRSIEYSPLGLLKNAAQTIGEAKLGDGINQSRLAMETARNLVGTGIFAGGALAAHNGLMSGGYSDDKDMRNAQKASGMQEYALDTGNGYLDLGWVPVLGNSLIAGAAAYDAAQKDPDATPLEVLGAGASAGIEQLFGQSMFQGLNRVFGGDSAYSSGSSIADNVVNAAKQGITQLNPSMLRQVVQSLDEYDREVYNSENDSALNNLMSGLPFLRQELQPKVDNEGNLVKSNQGRGLASRLFENMISPAKYTEKVSSPINDEAMRLFESTGNNYAFIPTAARNDIKADDGTMPTDEEFREYRQNLGTLNSENAEALLDSAYYKSLSDEEKELALRDLYSSMKVVAKEKAMPEYESDDKLASVYKEYGPNVMQDYMAANYQVKKDGSTGLAGANWQDALEAVESIGGLTQEDIGRLMRIRGDERAEEVYSGYGNSGVADFYDLMRLADYDSNGRVSSDEMIPFLQTSSIDDYKKGDYLTYAGIADSDKYNTIRSRYGSDVVWDYAASTAQDYNGDGKTGQEDMIVYLDSTDLTPVQKAYLFKTRYPDSKKRPWG